MPEKNDISIRTLRQNLDKLTTVVEESSLTEIKKSIDEIEAELQSKDNQIDELKDNIHKICSQKIAVEQEKNALSPRIDELLAEKAELEKSLRTLQQQRPQISSENLVNTFRQSLDSMTGKLNEPEARANYVVSSMNVKLKTNLSVKDDVLQFQLPKADDIIPPENLSTIEFTIKSSPKELDLSQYLEVPDLRGMTRNEAENAINKTGFKLGAIDERPSNSPQGLVIDQLPSANSLAKPNTAIDITISKIMHVETPNLVGLEVDSAREVLQDSQLELGEITETPAKSSPGTVVRQSIEPGTIVEIGTAVDVEVAAQEEEEETPESLVPDIKGKHVNEATEILKKKGMRVERVINRASTLKKGIVLDQNPEAGTEAKSVELVVANQDVEMIEGIGPERGSKLRSTGTKTIKELANKDAKSLSEIMGENTAEKIVSMAKLIDSTSTLEGLGMDRQSAEILVKAGNIHSLDALKNADPQKLYELCREAITSGKVKVPASYSIKQEDIKRWVEKAK